MAANWDKPVRKGDISAGQRKFAKRHASKLMRRMPLPLTDDDNHPNPTNRIRSTHPTFGLKNVVYYY